MSFPSIPLIYFPFFLSNIPLPLKVFLSSSFISPFSIFHFPSPHVPQFLISPHPSPLHPWLVCRSYESLRSKNTVILNLDWWEEETEKLSLLYQAKGMMEKAGLSTETASEETHGLLLKCSLCMIFLVGGSLLFKAVLKLPWESPWTMFYTMKYSW